MRALKVEELDWVSGGGVPLAQQEQNEAREAMADQLTALGFNADYIMGSVGTGGSGYTNTSLRGVPPGVGGAVLGALSAVVPGVLGAIRDGHISSSEWTMIAVTGLVGAAFGAAGLVVDPTITTNAAQWVWRMGIVAAGTASVYQFRGT